MLLRAPQLRFDDEDRPFAVCAAAARRSVKIAARPEDQSGIRVVPVFAVVVETMQGLLGPASVGVMLQLECGPVAINAAVVSGAVQIARGIENQTSHGVVSVARFR